MEILKLMFIGMILGILFASTLTISSRLLTLHSDLLRIERVLVK